KRDLSLLVREGRTKSGSPVSWAAFFSFVLVTMSSRRAARATLYSLAAGSSHWNSVIAQVSCNKQNVASTLPSSLPKSPIPRQRHRLQLGGGAVLVGRDGAL